MTPPPLLIAIRVSFVMVGMLVGLSLWITDAVTGSSALEDAGAYATGLGWIVGLLLCLGDES